jgi:DNA-binding NtrC family response regulator
MIYFIQAGENGPIKIGVTGGEVCERVKQLQTASPYKLNLIAIENGFKDAEIILHNKFKHLRMEGEWFGPGDDLVEYCSNLPKTIADMGYLPDLSEESIARCIKESFLDDILKEVESAYIKYALKTTNFNKSDAAGLLGITLRQMRYRSEVHKIRSINDCI